MVDAGEVARVVAKDVCDEVFASGQTAREFFTKRGLLQVRDEAQMHAWIEQVLADNAQVVADIQGGNEKALGRLVGATMKLSAGKADPKGVQQALRSYFGMA